MNREINIFEEVKRHYSGQWYETLVGKGIELPPFKKQGPCPMCGGTTRITFDDKYGNGNWICTNCGQGDGITLLAKVHGITNLEAAKELARSAGIDTKGDYKPLDTSKIYVNRILENDKRKKEAAQKLATGATKASDILNRYCEPASKKQSYLSKKGIKTYGTYQLKHDYKNGAITFKAGDLVVPIIGENGLQSLELISEDAKQGLSGGTKKGGYWPLCDLSSASRIWIAEGLATGAALEEIGESVVCSFSANMIKPAAETLAKQYPNAELYIAADNDSLKDNTGEKFARATGRPFSMPPYSGDWDDFKRAGGDVKAAIWEYLIDPRPKPSVEARAELAATIEAILQDFMSMHPSLDAEGYTDFLHALLVASAGTGKSTAALEAIRKLLDQINHAEYYAPTLKLADELAEKARALGIPTAVIRGRSQKAPNSDTPMCQRSEVAEKLGKAGIQVYSNLCKKGVKEPTYCPHYRECAYIKQFNTNAALRIHASAKFGMSRGLDCFEQDGAGDHVAPDFAIIDEQLHPALTHERKIDANQISKSVISSEAKAILLNWLTTGTKPEWCETLLLADVALSETLRKPAISPDYSDKDVSAALAAYKPESAMRRLVRSIEQGNDSTVEIVNDKFSVVWQSEIKRFDYSLNGKKHRIPVLNIDASGRKDVVTAVTSWNWKLYEINAQRENVKFVHVPKSFSKQSLGVTPSNNETMQANAERLRDELHDFITEKAAEHKKVLLVTYKDLKPLLDPLPPNVSVETFGALRGIDIHKDADCIIIAGRNQPNPAAARIKARAIFGDRALKYKSCETTTVEMIRDDETEQGIDRGRLVGNKDQKTVYILTDKLPKSITPNQTLNWGVMKGTRKSGELIIEQLVERFGGVPNVSLAYEMANDILNASNMDAAKKIYKRHIRESLRGQFPINIYIRSCPLNELSIRKPHIDVSINYDADVIKTKLAALGFEILEIVENEQAANLPLGSSADEIEYELSYEMEYSDLSALDEYEQTLNDCSANLQNSKTANLQDGKTSRAEAAEKPTPESPPAITATAEATFKTSCGASTPAAIEYQTQTAQPYREPLELLRNDGEIELLPDDYQWLRGLLRSRRDRAELLASYRRRWMDAMNDLRLGPHERQNVGRLAANQWILRTTANTQQLGAIP